MYEIFELKFLVQSYAAKLRHILSDEGGSDCYRRQGVKFGKLCSIVHIYCAVSEISGIRGRSPRDFFLRFYVVKLRIFKPFERGLKGLATKGGSK